MFTMKKLALCGFAAGLAALSMSCSDDGDDETTSAGSWTVPLTALDTPTDVVLSGVVTAEAGYKVKDITVTANDVAVNFVAGDKDAWNLPADIVTLAADRLVGVCGALNASGSTAVTFKATATFDDDSKVTSTVENVNVACGTTGGGVSVWSSTLSTSGNSYADLDASVTANSGSANATTVDFAAFAGATVGCTAGSICSPNVITTFSAALPDGSWATLCEVTGATASWDAVLAAPATASKPTGWNSAIDCGAEDAGYNLLPIVDGGWFVVYSSGADGTSDDWTGKYFAVKITEFVAGTSLKFSAFALSN